MKALSLLVFLTFFSLNSLFAQSGWFSQHWDMDGVYKLNSVYFNDSLNGWAVGDAGGIVGVILRTSNGGTNWTASYWDNDNYSYSFRSIYFPNLMTGWLVGLGVTLLNYHYSEIYKTTDGGSNWIRQYWVPGMGLNSVFFSNSSTGWAVGNNEILMTTNGGEIWITQVFYNGENEYCTLKSISFANSTTGFVLGSLYINPPGQRFGVILKTTNGGLNWIEQYRDNNYFLGGSIYFANSTTGFAVGYDGIFSTTDGGSNWIVQAGYGSENCDFYFNSVYFPNPATGWVVGGGSCMPGGGPFRIILKTTNGGTNWSEQYFYSGFFNNNYLNSVYFTNSTTGWAVGDSGIILKTADGGLVGMDPVNNLTLESYSLSQNYPNPFNPTTVIKYTLPKEGFVKLVIYDMLGREVSSLVNEVKQAGNYEVIWDASRFSSGVYFCKLSAGDFTHTRKMMLLK